MKKIFIIVGFKYNSKTSKFSENENVEMILGYYTNLKKAYSLLKGSSLPAYSTVARKIKKDKIILIHNIQVKINYKTLKTNEIIIKALEQNIMYNFFQPINLQSLIFGELFRNDIGLQLTV